MQITHNVDYNATIARIRARVEARAARLTDADAGVYERMRITERTISMLRDYIRAAVADVISMTITRYACECDTSSDASAYVEITLPVNARVDDARAWGHLDDYAHAAACARWYATAGAAQAAEEETQRASAAIAAFVRVLIPRDAPARVAPTPLTRESINFE